MTMQNSLQIDNYIIDAPITDILERLKFTLTNGKLKDIEAKSDDIAVTCPVHSGGLEKDPDCHINLGKNPKLPYGYYHCFACGASGTFDKFVAECFESTIEYAKTWLLNNFDSHIVFEKIDLGEDIVIGKTQKCKQKLDGSILNTYQSWCPYLAKRKLTRDICEKFNVKYDPYYRQIIFPCYDEHDNLIMMPKRSIDTKTFYLDSGVEKPVYLLNNIIKNKITKCIITEGPFDALTGNLYGFPTIATLGAISDEQIDKINKSGIQVIYAMFDNDAAGRKFTETLREKLNKRILFVDVRIPSPYKDINDLDYNTFWEIIKKA